MGRHRHGGGHFALGFMGGPGMGRGGFRTGRKLASGDLQLLILALLAEKHHHGYEIIKALEDRSRGFYSPSPGMVYPALTYLDEIGHAVIEAEGAKKLYRITDAGREHLERNRALADSLLAQLDRIGRKMERVREVFSGEDAAEDGDGDESGGAARREMARDVFEARRNLKAALIEKRGAPADEQRRIAEILRRATKEILGK